MPKPYSDDLRMRAVEKVLAGDSRRSVAKQLRVAASSLASIWRFLRVCGITRKKPAPVADERGRPDVQRRRERWTRFRGRADPRKLVFIDETCMKTNMSPRHGWGPKGRRVRGSAPFGHWGTFCISAVLFCSRRRRERPEKTKIRNDVRVHHRKRTNRTRHSLEEAKPA